MLVKLFNRRETTSPLADDLLPKDVDSLYVTIYIDGSLRGCMGLTVRNLDDDLKNAVEAALHDERFAGAAPVDPRSVAVTVSLLFDPLELGQASAEEIVNYYRHGEQTLMVYQGERVGLLLPFVASTWNLDAVGFAEAVIEKAGLTEPPYNWCRFDCVTWFAGSEGVLPTVGGFVSPDDDLPAIDDLIAKHGKLHVRYLLKHLRDDGTFYSRYQPFQNKLYEYVDPARQAHGAWVLARAHKIFGDEELQNAASSVIDNLIAHVVREGEDIWLRYADETPSVAEISFLLLALSNLPENDRASFVYQRPRRNFMAMHRTASRTHYNSP